MSCTEQARRAVEWSAKVVAVALVGGAGVQCHAYAQANRQGPLLPLKCQLDGKRGLESSRSGGEGGIDCVAHGFEDVATVPLDDIAQEGIVASEGSGHGVSMLLPEAG